MSDLQQYEQKLQRLEQGRSQHGIAIKKQLDGSAEVVLGLAGNGMTQIGPVTVHIDKDGATTSVEFPRQARSGSEALTASPKLTEVLLKNAGRQGADFLIGVANDIAGTRYTFDHTDPSQAFSKRATGDVGRRLGEAVGAIIDAAPNKGSEVISPISPNHPATARRNKTENGFKDSVRSTNGSGSKNQSI
jgi:hypothetical protein